MTLIVEDGTGVANAESFASVSFADDYHAKRGNTSWAALTTEVKEQLLRKATDYIVDIYSGAFIGVTVTSTQSLPWPRKNINYPTGLQKATVELASIARTTALLPNITRGKKRVKVGPIEVEYDGNAPTPTKFVNASLKLAPLLKGLSNNTAKLIRR